MLLAFRPNLGEQIGQGIDVVVVKDLEHLEGIGVAGEAFPELFRGGVVKEGDLLVLVRHDLGVAQLLGVRHVADAAPEDGLHPPQRYQRFDIEELVAAGLEERGDVGGAVIRGQIERLQRRHFASVECALEFGDDFSLAVALDFRAFEIAGNLLFERGQDLIAAVSFLEVFLMVGEPEGGVSAEEDEEKLGGPAAEARDEWAFRLEVSSHRSEGREALTFPSATREREDPPSREATAW